MTECSAEITANRLFIDLMDGMVIPLPENIDFSGPEFEIPGGPDNPIYLPVAKLTNAELTTRVVGGDGTFDWLMSSVHAHLQGEYDKGRITGAEYTKAYIALTQAAMGSAVQYLLQRDTAFWQAANAQIAAITAKVNLVTAQAMYASQKATALNNQAQFVLTKLKLSTENEAVCTAQFNLTQILPQQLLNLEAQETLIKAQKEVQRAQVSDSFLEKDIITDPDTGLPVEIDVPYSGVIGVQKRLLEQQITSYLRDAETKAGKLFADGWNVQKTIDEGLLPPTALTNPIINEVLETIRQNNRLVIPE